MPQDIVESFARSLIDQIVLEASDETITRPRKEVSQTNTQPNNMYMGYSKREEQEVLDRMVNDLRDVQIGDSHYVYSPPVSRFDRQQMRRPACFVDNASIDVDTGDVVEMSGIQGQGDVESIARDTESTAAESKAGGSASTASNSYRREREQTTTNDATKVTINVLHRMIEELETVTEDSNDTNEDNKIDERTKEEIAIWEEKEERLIRIIEGNEGSYVSVAEESRSSRQFVDEEREELKSSMLMSGASSSRNLSIDEVYVEEDTSDCQAQLASTIANDGDNGDGGAAEIEGSQVVAEETKETEKETKSEDKKKTMKKKKKKMEPEGGKKESVGRRLKRFFLRSFRREKN